MSFTVRLAEGPGSHEGRLELYHNSVWGTVCDDGFTDAAARVVCHSLGFRYVIETWELVFDKVINGFHVCFSTSRVINIHSYSQG